MSSNPNRKKKKPHRPHSGLPAGVTYADKLAYEKRKAEAIEKAAADGMVELRANEHTQRAMWLMVCSIADAYGFGPTRMKTFFETLQQNSEELEQMIDSVDEEYAWEVCGRKRRRSAESRLSIIWMSRPERPDWGRWNNEERACD